MRQKLIAAAVAVLVVAGACAVPATAKPRRVRQPAAEEVQLQGHASKGFKFTYFTLGSLGSVLWLSQTESSAGEQSAVYFATPGGRGGTFANRRLDVRIGDLGHFRGHFVPDSSKTEQPEKGCSGSPTTTEKGHFVGSFSFHGEMGFTKIETRRVQGDVIRQGATNCPAPARSGHRRHRSPRREREAKERRQEEVRLLAGDADGHLVFQATREASPVPEEGTPTTFSATVTERSHGLQVDRSATVFEIGEGTATAFQVPNLAELPTEATVSPSAPFYGSATFNLSDPKTATWTGDLAVELPGVGTVPLTGEGISAGLCHGPTRCTRTLPALLQKELESSSTFYGETSEVQRIS